MAVRPRQLSLRANVTTCCSATTVPNNTLNEMNTLCEWEEEVSGLELSWAKASCWLWWLIGCGD